MEHLLAMILTAYDPLVNPVAGLLKCRASQACESMVQLLQTAGTLSVTAEDYTKNRENMHGRNTAGPTYRMVNPDGRVVFVGAATYA